MVPSPINPASQFITACSQADLHYPKCSSTVFSIPVQACFKDLCLEVNIRELNREKGLLWKWRLRSKEVQSLPCDLYRNKIAIFILLPFHVLPSFFGPTCPRCVWGTSWMLMNFTACYLWHKNKCCPFTGRSVEPSWARAETEKGGVASMGTTEQFCSSDLLRHSTAPCKNMEKFLTVKSLCQQAE